MSAASELEVKIKAARKEVDFCDQIATDAHQDYLDTPRGTEEEQFKAEAWAMAEDTRAEALSELVNLLDEALGAIRGFAECGS